ELSNQDLKNSYSVNHIWERDVNLECRKNVKIAYAKDDSIPRVNGFLVIESGWPDQFPEILLDSLWMRENS
ncbi:10059_t:CDS:2, partial [Dentiscutata heterogama]